MNPGSENGAKAHYNELEQIRNGWKGMHECRKRIHEHQKRMLRCNTWISDRLGYFQAKAVASAYQNSPITPALTTMDRYNHLFLLKHKNTNEKKNNAPGISIQKSAK